MKDAMAGQIAARMLIAFVVAMAALLLGIILIRRMRLLVDEEVVPGTLQPHGAGGDLEHGATLPRKSGSK